MDPLNRNLNSAFAPKWTTPASATPGTDTGIDPFLGTGWDKELDAMGASNPGGASLKLGVSPASMVGLRQAAGLDLSPETQDPHSPSSMALQTAKAKFLTAGGQG